LDTPKQPTKPTRPTVVIFEQVRQFMKGTDGPWAGDFASAICGSPGLYANPEAGEQAGARGGFCVSASLLRLWCLGLYFLPPTPCNSNPLCH
jgi:hypothetical protein